MCNHTGFRGRLALHEVLPVQRDVRRFILERQPAETYREWGKKYGYDSMLIDGLRKVTTGETTIPEVLKVVLLED